MSTEESQKAPETTAPVEEPKVEPAPKGDMIPKASYDAVAEKYRANKAELDTLKAQHSELETQITAFSEKESKFVDAIKSQAVNLELTKAGTIDTELASKVLDMSSIEFDAESLSVRTESIASQIDGLKESKPFLFQKPEKQPSPSGFDGSDSNTGKARIYTKEELKDSVFVKNNLQDIILARSEGRIR
jgi:hypothetical protein